MWSLYVEFYEGNILYVLSKGFVNKRKYCISFFFEKDYGEKRSVKEKNMLFLYGKNFLKGIYR